MPETVDSVAERIEAADGYVMVSPEYNHGIRSALAHLLDYFGSSPFPYPPRVIVTYSAGLWGGTPAGVALRPFLCELAGLGNGSDTRGTDGLQGRRRLQEGLRSRRQARLHGRTFTPLDWWAAGAARHRSEAVDPLSLIKPFRQSPSQRNAPSDD